MHKIGAAVAVAFFAAENVERRFLQPQPARFFLRQLPVIWCGCFFLVLIQFRAVIFETGERIDAAQSEFLRDRFLQIAGDESFDDDAAMCVLFV